MTWADRCLIGAVLIALLLVYQNFWNNHSEHGAYVEIGVNGKVVQTLLLKEPGRYSIEGSLGQSIIEIKDKRARFLASPCAGKQCIHMGWQSFSGSFSACLPNRITLAVRGSVPRWDAVNF